MISSRVELSGGAHLAGRRLCVALLAIAALGAISPAGAQRIDFGFGPPVDLSSDVQTDPGSFDREDDRDARVATDGRGRWITFWRTGGEIRFARSTDDGATWADFQVLEAPDVASGFGGVRIAADGGGDWLAAWAGAAGSERDLRSDRIDSEILYSRSTDSGESWSAAAVLNVGFEIDGPDDRDPVIVSGGGGVWLAAWGVDGMSDGPLGMDQDLLTARSTDRGATWSAPRPLNTNASEDSGDDNAPAVAADGAGNWLAVWSSGEEIAPFIGTDLDLLFARSIDDGITWSAPTVLNNNALGDSGDDREAWIDTDSAGTWIAVWNSDSELGGAAGDDDDVLYSRSLNLGVSWSDPAILTDDGTSDRRDARPAIIHETGERWTAVWKRGAAELAVATSSDGGASWSGPRRINLGGVSPVFSLASDGGGRLVAVFSSNRWSTAYGTDLDIFSVGSGDGGARWSDAVAVNSNATAPPEVIPPQRSQTEPSVATDGEGNWIAVWHVLLSTANIDVLYSVSSDDGRTWSTRAQPFSGGLTTDLFDFDAEAIALGPESWLVLWRGTRLPGNQLSYDSDGDIFSVKTTDNGKTWSRPRPINTNAQGDDGHDQLVDIDRGGNGTLVAVWDSGAPLLQSFRVGSDRDILFARSTDDGDSWSELEPIGIGLARASDVHDDIAPQVQTDGAGVWVAVWQSQEVQGGILGDDDDILFARSVDDGVTWSAPAPLVQGAFGDFGYDVLPTIATDRAGNWIVAWWTNNAANPLAPRVSLVFSASTDNGASWSAARAIDSPAGFGSARPHLAANGRRTWAIVWNSYDPHLDPDQSEGRIMISRTEDLGATWTLPSPLMPEGLAIPRETHPGLATDGWGRWVAVWEGDAALGGGSLPSRVFASASSSLDADAAPFEFVDARDFAAVGDEGGAWLSGVAMGEGAAVVGPGGLCLAVPALGDNIPVWVSPEDLIELVDDSLYRVRVRVATDQRDPGAIPFWSVSHDNFHRSGFGNTYGGESLFLDSAGGANGIGRPQGRDTFDVYIAPMAASTAQWRGAATGGTRGAFDPAFDDFNDLRLIFRVLDIGSAGINANADSGTICIESIRIDRFPISALEVESVVYDVPLSPATHAAHVFGQDPFEGAIDATTHRARYRLGSVDAATLIPAVAPFDRAGLYPIQWESDGLYRVRALVQSADDSTESDPVDYTSLIVDTATNELIQIAWTNRGAPGNMFRTGSPHKPEFADGPQSYSMYFFSHNATESPLELDDRWRPQWHALNSEALAGAGTGADSFEVLGLRVEKLVLPPG